MISTRDVTSSPSICGLAIIFQLVVLGLCVGLYIFFSCHRFARGEAPFARSTLDEAQEAHGDKARPAAASSCEGKKSTELLLPEFKGLECPASVS